MLADPSDCYAILEVDPRATAEQIRAAYRALARKFHPDAIGGSQERMVALNHAWETLRDPRRRAAYDRARGKTTEQKAGSVRPGPLARRTQQANQRRPVLMLDFGRYAGWSVQDLARHDPGYLEWLARTPAGRRLSLDIAAALQPSGA